MLSELIYVSSRINIGDDKEIEDILSVCQKNNKNKITGALLYSQTKFIQYLEGDYKDVKATFEKIGTDDRHQRVQLVVFSPIKERIFPGWAMGRKNMEDLSIIMRSGLTDEEALIWKGLLEGSPGKEHALSGIIGKFFL